MWSDLSEGLTLAQGDPWEGAKEGQEAADSWKEHTWSKKGGGV